MDLQGEKKCTEVDAVVDLETLTKKSGIFADCYKMLTNFRSFNFPDAPPF